MGIFSADSASIFSALVTLALDEEIKYFIILSPGSEERSYIYSNLLLVSLNQVRTHTSVEFQYKLLITFAISLDPDQDRQNVQTVLTLIVFLKEQECSLKDS